MVRMIQVGVLEVTDSEDQLLLDDYAQRTLIPESLQGLSLVEIYEKLSLVDIFNRLDAHIEEDPTKCAALSITA